MKILVAIFIFFITAIYLIVPSPDFPPPPPDSVRSSEPADTESPLRRAYFTNMSREEVINFYRKSFDGNTRFFSIRLNYPPEEAQTIIRDQTRSTYLEEIVHPLRETIYINGFEPKEKKDEIWYEGKHFRQKVIVRYVPSSSITRLSIWFCTFVIGYFIFKELTNFCNLKK